MSLKRTINMTEESANNISKVYAAFDKEFKELMRLNRILNTIVTNPNITTRDVRKITEDDRRKARNTTYGAAFMTAFVKWEAFVQDFLQESFSKLIDHLADDKSLHTRAEKLQKAEELLKKAFEYRCRHDKKSDLRVQLVIHQDMWKTVLKEYMEDACKGCQPTFKGISEYFGKLFCVKVDMAEEMYGDCSWELSCIIFRREHDPKPSIEPRISFKTHEALKNLTQLYYGIRCVLSHANSKKTFSRGGVLDPAEFPDETKFSEQMDAVHPTEEIRSKVIGTFYFLYKQAQRAHENEDDIFWLLHCDIVNFQRYVLAVSAQLHNTVVRLIEEHYGVKIWDAVSPPNCTATVPLN